MAEESSRLRALIMTRSGTMEVSALSREVGVLDILVRECVCGAHVRTQGDHPFNVKVLEKESPASLMTGEFTRVFYIRKIFVVSNNGNREGGALKIMFSLRKSKNDCEEFAVIDIIVSFSKGEHFREVSTRMQVIINIFCMRIASMVRREASVMMKKG